MATDQLSTTFAALADPTRRAILDRLTEGEATVNELAEPFPITVQAVSRHIKVLEHAGLVTRGRSRQLRFTLTDQPGGEQRDRCAVELTDLGDGRTEMRFEQSGGGLTPDGYEAAKHGWGVFFDRMAEGVAGGP